MTSTATVKYKSEISLNFAPVSVIISGNSLGFWESVASSGFLSVLRHDVSAPVVATKIVSH